MTVPKLTEIYRPVLELLGDGKPYSSQDILTAIAKRFSLTPEDIAERIPSGQRRLVNRVNWAKFELRRAGLIQSASRGIYSITDFGRSQLNELPLNFDETFLKKEGWGSWGDSEKPARDTGKEVEPVAPHINEGTPDERIDDAFDELKEGLTEEVLERLKRLSPASFERFVVELLKAMDYGIGDGEVTGRTGDGGIDGVIYQDRLRLDRIYLQAKRWEASQPVRSPDINGFIGALARKGATRGVFVTTSRYTDDAVAAAAEVRNQHVKLIDGTELAKLAIEYNVGVSVKRKLEIKRLDSDYFEEIEES